MPESKIKTKVIQLQLTEGELMVLMASFGHGCMVMLEAVSDLPRSAAGDNARVEYMREFLAGMALTSADEIRAMMVRMRLLQKEGFK